MRKSRLGSSLSHGRAHEADHRTWNRRDFLSQLSAGGIAASFMMGSQPVQAYSYHPLAAALQAGDTDRVLVLVQLNGGNDGLNTVIPVQNDTYYALRPNISIPQSEAVSLGSDFGLHPLMAPLESVWGDGNLGIVHGVGYPDPNLSHFRSTDIWSTASNSDEFLSSGWLGRHFESENPDFETSPPAHPLAVQLGQASSLILQGPVGPMGMNIANQNILERLANGGQLYDEVAVPESMHGDQLAFVRTIANDSYHYAGVIHEALTAGENQVAYPEQNVLATDLASVARMIKGGLPTRLYLVSLGGFDTHANQSFRHEALMDDLASAMRAFSDDLNASGHQECVLTMTFSEFGRRVEENGSRGTDHGTAAPLFVMGDAVNGGFYGDAPSLETLDTRGNLIHTTDFRSVYATVLENWLGVEAGSVDALFGQSFDRLDFVEDGNTGVSTEGEAITSFALEQNYPNPFAQSTSIKFSLSEAEEVKLTVYDVSGKAVSVVANRTYARGEHTVAFDAGSLASGLYIYQLETPSQRISRQMTVVR
ncbi:MAG: DUF1501 domain-containing protein [Rhodothermales bacterium]